MARFKRVLTVFSKTLHRLRLEELLQEHQTRLRGEVLDIGSKNRRYDGWLSNTTRIDAIDLIPNAEQDVRFGNIEAGLDFPDRCYDGVLMIEVLEYLRDPRAALREVSRLLALGGKAIISIPFLYAEHGDRLRFTEAGLREILPPDLRVMACERIGNSYTVLADIGWGICRSKSFALRTLLSALWLPVLWLARSRLVWRRVDGVYSGLFLVVERLP